MGEVQETIASRKCQRFDVTFTKDFSRGSKADRCSSKSEVGASAGLASKESGVDWKVQTNRPGLQIGPFGFKESRATICNRIERTFSTKGSESTKRKGCLNG